jgi:hypothetical protein
MTRLPRSSTVHRPRLILATTAALAATAVIPAAHGAGAPAQRAAAAQGTVSVTPSILETTARRGASTSTVIRNSSGRRLTFTLKTRPWRQSRSGAVTADRSRTLGGLALSAKRFRLGPGKSRRVYVTLGSVPGSGSRYGALDAVAKPKRGSGVNVAYRLVASLRFNPSAGARRHALRAGTASASGGTLGVLVRNAGNTADPVGGTVRITGGGGARTGTASAVRILPGKLVRVKLASTRGLRKGSYSARITLTQGGKTRLATTRRFTVG